MEIVLNVNDALPQILMVSGIIASKNVIPILANLYFSIDEEKGMTVMGSNSESWVTSPVTVQSFNLDGSKSVAFCLETALLLQALKNMPNKQLSMVFNEKDKIVTCGYNEGVFKMPFLSADEYPQPTDVAGENIEIGANNLCYAIAKTKGASTNDNLRPQLNGIHFNYDNGKMDFVATDAHRLAVFSDDTIKANVETINATLPINALQVVSNLAANSGEDNVLLALSETNAKFTFSNGCIVVTRKIEGRYPNYNNVIPKEGTDCAVIAKQATIDALKRIMPMGNATSGLVVMDFGETRKKSFTLSAEDADFERSAQEDVLCVDYQGSTFKIGFNGNYLLQALQNFDCDQVRIMMNGATKGVVLSPEDKEIKYLYLLMPTVIS